MFSRVEGEAAKFVSVVPAIQEFAKDSITLVDGRVLTDVDVVLFASTVLFTAASLSPCSSRAMCQLDTSSLFLS